MTNVQIWSEILEECICAIFTGIAERGTRFRRLTIIRAPTRISAGPVAKLGMLAVMHKRSQNTKINGMWISGSNCGQLLKEKSL